MAIEGLGAARNQLRRWMLVIAAGELIIGMGMGLTWVSSGLAEARVVAPMVVLHWLLLATYLRVRLRPLDALWRGDQDSDGALLLAANTTLQTLPRHAALGGALGWGLIEGSWLLFAVADAPFAPTLAQAELLSGLLFVCASPGFTPLYELCIEALVSDTRTEVVLLCQRRELVTRQPQRSFIRPFVATAVSMLVGTCLTIGGGALSWHAINERAHIMELQSERLTHSATLVTQGEDPLPGVELRAPPPSQPDATERGQPQLRFEPERELVVGVLTLPDGRALVSETAPETRLTRLTTFLLLIIGLGAPLFAVTFWLAGRTLTTPIERLRGAAREFVEAGEVQLLERIVASRHDEIGQLAASIAEVFEVLARLSTAAEAVSAGDLSVTLEHPGALHDAFRGMLVRLNQTVSSLRSTSIELASAAAEINALLEQQVEAALEQSQNIQHVAMTVSSLAASAEQIANAAQGVRSDADDVVATTDASTAQIAVLREHTAAIAELLVSIAEVASRSDLLALNGSLEATRAGEAGRGFALVAAEMRRLAERVAGTVAVVREQVANIESSSGQTVVATEQSRSLAKRTADAARAIDELTAAQSDDTEQASMSVQAAADMVVKTTSSVSQVRTAISGLHDHALELEELLRGFSLRDAGSR